jgi:hypothetical protein
VDARHKAGHDVERLAADRQCSRELQMRILLCFTGLLLSTLVAEQTTAASAQQKQPYEGVWASNHKACYDEDGVNRMAIEGNRFSWYETRCRASDIRAVYDKTWTMRMACEGEGEKYSAEPRLILTAPDRLTMRNSPVGQKGKRDAYVRCDPRKVPRY